MFDGIMDKILYINMLDQMLLTFIMCMVIDLWHTMIQSTHTRQLESFWRRKVCSGGVLLQSPPLILILILFKTFVMR